MSSLVIPTKELKSLRDWVRWSASSFNAAGLFYGHGTDNAFDDALELVLASLHLDHSLPESYLDARVSIQEAEILADRVRRRIEQRVPVAYLTGRAYFAGLEFIVDENVLVPRSPLAELIIEQFQPWLGNLEVNHILDLCTGSGCIGIACAYAFAEASVDLADISPEALEIARRNIEKHQLDERVQARHSDVFDGLKGEKYELIVSNPPYVSISEMKGLPEEYGHEPSLGLVAGEDGMDIVSRMLCEAPAHLSANGIIVIEVGASADLLMARYPSVPFLWLDFEHGGDGVFMLTVEQLNDYHAIFLEG